MSLTSKKDIQKIEVLNQLVNDLVHIESDKWVGKTVRIQGVLSSEFKVNDVYISGPDDNLCAELDSGGKPVRLSLLEVVEEKKVCAFLGGQKS